MIKIKIAILISIVQIVSRYTYVLISRFGIEVTILKSHNSSLRSSEMQLRPYLDDLRCKLPLLPAHCPRVGTHKDGDGDGMHKSGSCLILLPYSQIITKEFSYCAKCNATFFRPVLPEMETFLY